MTVNDLRCDICSSFVAGPAAAGGTEHAAGVRLVYHPGSAELRDDSGLLCTGCWDELSHWLGGTKPWRQCAVCQQPVTRTSSLHLRRGDEAEAWQLCAGHAVEFLNRLRTVQPKIDAASFRFPLAAQAEPLDTA